VKLVPETPCHLTEHEEAALLRALDMALPRDRTMIILLLHTALRTQEFCNLQRHDVLLGRRSGLLQIYEKRNKHREISLNSTARAMLTAYLPTLPQESQYLFPSSKTGAALTVRRLAHCKGYVEQAKLENVSLHDVRHRFGYRMAESVPLHRLAAILGHDSLDSTLVFSCATKQDLQREVEKIAWI
jgi:integrase/recombinase XerD